MKHTHHIIPRHAGGSDDSSNLIELTITEHAEAHKKLYEEYSKEEDRIAWLGLAGMIDKEEIIRQQCSLAAKKGNTGRTRPDFVGYLKGEGRNHHGGGKNKGVPMSEETKKLMSERRKGIPSKPEDNKKRSEAMKKYWENKRLNKKK